MSTASERAIIDMKLLGAELRARRRRGVRWKELVAEFGLCRARLAQLANCNKNAEKIEILAAKPKTQKRIQKKCL